MSFIPSFLGDSSFKESLVVIGVNFRFTMKQSTMDGYGLNIMKQDHQKVSGNVMACSYRHRTS